MKPFYTLLLAVLAHAAIAQNKTSLPNSVWTGYSSDRPETFDFFTTTEDTVPGDGLTYLKLFHRQYTSGGNNEITYRGALRHDPAADRIYYLPIASAQPAILYDFKLQAGDTLKKEDGYYLHDDSGRMPVVVASVDSVYSLDSVWRKRFRFSGIAAGSTVIEGIGNTGRNLLAVLDLVPAGNDTRFGCYKRANDCVFATSNCNDCYGSVVGLSKRHTQTPVVGVYPNPVRDRLILDAAGVQAGMLEIFDANGRQVKSEPFSGRGNTEIAVDHLPAGFYFYLVKANGLVQPGRFLKN